MKTIEVLRAARELLSEPSRWRKGGGFAVDAFGGIVPPRSPDACAWCVLGAIYKVGALVRGAQAETALYPALGRGSLIVFNDRRSTTHEQLIALFDKAIHAESQSG